MVFSLLSPKQFRIVKEVVHRIKTGSALPYKQRPIPVTPAVEAEIAKIVKVMLQNICRLSDSSWVSNILVTNEMLPNDSSWIIDN